MKRYISFEPEIFEYIPYDDEDKMVDWYVDVMEQLVTTDKKWLKTNPGAPTVAASGVRPGLILREARSDISSMLHHGSGDLDSLAAWRIAELRIQGVDAKPVLIKGRRGDKTTFTVRVQLPDGTYDQMFDELVSGRSS